MHSNLLHQALLKAQDTISSDKPTHLSRHLSDYILEDSHEPFGEKSLRNYYKLIGTGKKINLKPFVVQSLCHYLGYANYEAYILNISKKKSFHKKSLRMCFISQGFMIIVTMFFFMTFFCSFKRKKHNVGQLLRDCHTDLEHHFYRLERLMRYMQGEAA